MIAVRLVRKNVLGGKFLKTNVVASSAIAVAQAAVLQKDAIGGKFGKTDVSFLPLRATIVVAATNYMRS